MKAQAWREEELAAAVRAYLSMLSKEKASKPYNKKDVYRELATKFGRTDKAFEYRMQNISHVLNAMGHQWIAGLKPAKNVGNGIANVIEKQILTQEGHDLSMAALVFPNAGVVREFDRDKDGQILWPFRAGVSDEDLGFTPEDFEELERQANHSRTVEVGTTAPAGVMCPEEVSSDRREFARDKTVVTWVVARSNGVCECCMKPAPFNKPDGTPFLEVHHLRQLANKGTDRVSNAIAACPNCHRQLHFGANAPALLDDIYGRVTGLERE